MNKQQVIDAVKEALQQGKDITVSAGTPDHSLVVFNGDVGFTCENGGSNDDLWMVDTDNTVEQMVDLLAEVAEGEFIVSEGSGYV